MELIDVCVGAQGRPCRARRRPAAAPPRSPASATAARSSVCFAPALAIAKKLVRMGADAIVIEGREAGGHIGPVSTAVLAQEILPHITEVPVFVAGGIGRGEAILSYLEMGAAGVQLGTRFVCAHESIAHPRFKQRLHPRRGARRGALGAARRALSGDPGARARQRRRPSAFARLQRAGHRPLQPRRAVAKGRAARDRAFLGRRAAPRRHRRRCRDRLADGRAERRHGDPRAKHGRDPRRAGRAGAGGDRRVARRSRPACAAAPQEAGPG